jgi:hypothetical protein
MIKDISEEPLFPGYILVPIFMLHFHKVSSLNIRRSEALKRHTKGYKCVTKQIVRLKIPFLGICYFNDNFVCPSPVVYIFKFHSHRLIWNFPLKCEPLASFSVFA